eukprot:TRINITY_DN12783_c0_g1_i1.p1 TRINITY_DN12783_c0_g1~~TRINITY_DN12783_c0_g1_i1.p1  ORF type:complete len:292 (-),score=67.08 TRINITY_DN12783_c0_g1_i1:9-884(-)
MARLGRGVGACSAAQGAGSPAASIGTDSGNAHDLQPERRGGYGIGTNGHANAEAEQADLHQRTGDSAITTAIDDGLHGSRSAVASCGKEDRGVDASLDDSNVDWSDIFGVATSAPLTSVEAAGTAEAACSSRSSSVGVGTDAAVPNVSVGVQAQLPSTAVAAGSSLSELETARVEGFLQSLRETNGAANALTVNTLLVLLKSLSAPAAQRGLMVRLQQEQPRLFARLHESMRRTQERTRGMHGDDKLATARSSLRADGIAEEETQRAAPGSLLLEGTARPLQAASRLADMD